MLASFAFLDKLSRTELSQPSAADQESVQYATHFVRQLVSLDQTHLNTSSTFQTFLRTHSFLTNDSNKLLSSDYKSVTERR